MVWRVAGTVETVEAVETVETQRFSRVAGETNEGIAIGREARGLSSPKEATRVSAVEVSGVISGARLSGGGEGGEHKDRDTGFFESELVRDCGKGE